MSSFIDIDNLQSDDLLVKFLELWLNDLKKSRMSCKVARAPLKISVAELFNNDNFAKL